jgi:hypothetical protein
MKGELARTTGSDVALGPGAGLWQDSRPRRPRAIAVVRLAEY